jgi:hypothetical protein
MFKKRISHPTGDLLPWYLNHSLPGTERSAAEEQARRSAQTMSAWQAVRLAALSQPSHLPKPVVRQRVLAQARTTFPARRMPRWLPVLSGVIFAVLALLLLWNVVQPGISLQWSVNGVMPTAFRVYRAPEGSDRFEILREIPAKSGIMNYSYVDTALWPGQTYEYRVEAVNDRMVSATVAATGAEILPAQLAIILSSLLIGIAGAYALREAAALHGPARWNAV